MKPWPAGTTLTDTRFAYSTCFRSVDAKRCNDSVGLLEEGAIVLEIGSIEFGGAPAVNKGATLVSPVAEEAVAVGHHRPAHLRRFKAAPGVSLRGFGPFA